MNLCESPKPRLIFQIHNPLNSKPSSIKKLNSMLKDEIKKISIFFFQSTKIAIRK
jgi:hypothetical protein